MENKNLKGINFPGLNGTYFVAMNEFTEDTEHPGCYYRMVDGEKEWLNPPMVAGVEYRTTERYMGKVSYTKLVNCGNMPSKTHRYYPSGVDANTVYEINSFAYYSVNNSLQPFPLHSVTTGGITAVCWAEATNIAIQCIYDESHGTATATIKYTK